MLAKLLVSLALERGNGGDKCLLNAGGLRIHFGAKVRRDVGRKTDRINAEFDQTGGKCPLCGNGFTPGFFGRSGVFL